MLTNCKFCKNEFESIRGSLYCSTYCQGQAKKKPKECVGCGSTYLTKNKQQRYCSVKCGQRHVHADARVQLKCTKCGKLFNREKSRIRHATVYCSRDCSDGTLKPSRVTSRILSCSLCQSQFKREKNAIRDGYNYCSHTCYSNHYAELGLRRGQNNGRYNADITQEERIVRRNYPEYVEWRRQVYERDNYTCNRCGKRGVELHAHHLFNYAEHIELRTDVDNGVTLCSSCHTEFHVYYGRRNNTQAQFEEFTRKIS